MPISNCGYCEQARRLGTMELQCSKCEKWFHEECLKNAKPARICAFMINYVFTCRDCHPQKKEETFSQRQHNFSQLAITALANLSFSEEKKNADGKRIFSKEKELIPFVESDWENLTSMPRRTNKAWYGTIAKQMGRSDLFLHVKENGEDFFGLVENDLYAIGPCFEAKNNSKSDSANSNGFNCEGAALAPNSKSKGSGKRKNQDSQTSGGGGAGAAKKSRGDSIMSKQEKSGFPVDYPFNRDGYRYWLAEEDPHAPNRQQFDEKDDYAGKPIPSYLYRAIRAEIVTISPYDRTPQMKISDDRLTLTGEKGYSVARCTHGVSKGRWYYEVTILDQPEGSHARLGWAQALACLQAPLGYDKFSYSWRSRKGTVFHESIGKHYMDDGGFQSGDVLGFFIDLPEVFPISSHLPLTFKTEPLIRFKSRYYYEEKDEPQLAVKALKPLPGSKMIFFKNGKPLGVAFADFYAGTYYPAVSLYKNMTIRCNFGPNFAAPPAPNLFSNFRPMSDRVLELHVEQSMADMLFFIENEGKLTLD